ncbi:MAG: LPS export ABC transporter permease LptF [Acidocella sp. 20-57-95]|nr:MAG: LPS export ABC transporter permease LptF [Acidocella sp. 20-57-95]OYV62105.1 MAG: LPS export ABC transporter permease LptF [Acidocella sp. 21-58-7]HQT63019.1 LPS export ABC transporter permease LptF [Acidocella sp.]HQU03151.1 LPS export ABC transporter permease LptF [Acidocella sp.]
MPRPQTINRIDRYIFNQLSLSLVLVTTGLVALIWLTQSLRFIQIIVNRGLSPLVFIKLTALLVPSFVATILPITCFIVVVFVYARLSGDRELTVMRAAGMSDLALARPALGLAALVMLVCYVLNIFMVPAALDSFRTYQFEIRNQIAAFLLEPGVFTPVSDGVTVYVQSRGADNSLKGILIEDSRDRDAPATILARAGQLVVTPQGPVVMLQDGSRQQVDPKTGRLDVLTFASNNINLAQSAKAASIDETDSAAVSLMDLFHPRASLSPAVRAKWLVEAQRRLSAPLTSIGFTLIGLFAVLGGAFRRHGGVLRPLVSVAVVTFLVAMNLAVNNFAARSLALLPTIWVAVLVPGVLAGLLLFLPHRFKVRR